jgi:hypothetical protein
MRYALRSRIIADARLEFWRDRGDPISGGHGTQRLAARPPLYIWGDRNQGDKPFIYHF